MKSFHVARNVKTASVTRIGRSSGSTIDQKMRNSLAPSMRAASSSSSGIDERVLAHQEDAEDARESAGSSTPQ